MKRNELRLRIWNSLGGSITDENLLSEICTNTNDEELGVWFELFSDSQILDSFLQVYAKEQQFKQLLSQHPYYQKMVSGYMEMMSATYFEKVKRQAAARTYHYWLEAIQELYAFNFDKQLIMLRAYCHDMLEQLKDTNADASNSEALLLDVLENEADYIDDELLYIFMTVLLHGVPWSYEVEKIEEIYLIYKDRLEEYAKNLDDKFALSVD